MPTPTPSVASASSPNNYRLFRSGIAALILVATLLAGVTLTQLHQQAENRATVSTQNLAKSLEQTFDGLIDTIDIALLASSNELGEHLSSGSVDSESINRMLIEMREHIPYVAYFRATDESGNILYGPDVSSPPVNTSDREHFIRLRDDPKLELVSDKPFLGRIINKWVWTFARRINKADGTFGGVVFAGVSIDELNKLLAKIKIDPGSSISLRDAELRILARYPSDSLSSFPIGEKNRSQKFQEALDRNPLEGTYSSGTTSVDGVDRTYSYSRSAKHGFIVNVGIDNDSVFKGWRKQAWIVGAFVASFILALLGFMQLVRRAWQRQSEMAASLQEAQRIAHLGHYSFDLLTQQWKSSEIFDEIFGLDGNYPRDRQHWLALASPKDSAAWEGHLNRPLGKHLPVGRAFRIIRRRDGEERWISCLDTLQLSEDGTPLAMIGTIQDITEHKQVETDLRIAAVAFDSQEAMVITDQNSVILRVNRAFTENTGYTAEEALGQNPRLLKSNRHPPEFFKAMWDTINRTGGWQGEIWDRRKDGAEYQKWLTISAVKNAEGAVTHYIGAQFDITERKKAEEKINELAFFDQLTGLPNRTLLLDRLRQAMTSSSRDSRYGAVLHLDLDSFKTLNDTRGHDMGDLLLQHVAKRLTDSIRAEDTVARLGADEFVVILKNLSSEQDDAARQTELVGEKIIAAVSQPYLLADTVYSITPSIGASVFLGDQTELETALKQADLAMDRAKKEGGNAVRFFDPDMEVSVMKRAALEKDLREAIQKRQFALHYQPQVAQSQLTGAEVLVRWQHPQRGLVSPAEFIPLAEETGLILPLGRWVLETACQQLAVWATRPEMAHLTIAVNVSAHQFQQADFVDQVIAVLDTTRANPQRLKIELTESMLVANVEEVIRKMLSLKAKGVGFSLDDFGTGYSSLTYLKRLPLDQLKIDQSFVREILTSSNDAAIARAVITLAQSLGLGVIAEGVETETQKDFLAASGCQAYQGYLFSRPLPLDDFEAYAQRTAVVRGSVVES